PDRTFILMALAEEWMDGNGSDAFITEAALVEEGKQIDSDIWMATLRREPPSRDPDLQPTRQGRFLTPIAVFILTHATDILAPEHVEELLRLNETWEQAARAGTAPGGFEHRWIIAAGRLQPTKGVGWLKSSYKRFDRPFYRDRQAQLSSVETTIIPNSRSQFIRLEKWLLDDSSLQF
ncbi:MAG: hypothetical protein KDA84_06755, partial [Planctomycetaceae bacterium]|nr:hypothetical protein [Planctomycetaceae bacterium]